MEDYKATTRNVHQLIDLYMTRYDIRILPEIRLKASMNDFIDSLIDEVGKK